MVGLDSSVELADRVMELTKIELLQVTIGPSSSHMGSVIEFPLSHKTNIDAHLCMYPVKHETCCVTSSHCRLALHTLHN